MFKYGSKRYSDREQITRIVSNYITVILTVVRMRIKLVTPVVQYNYCFLFFFFFPFWGGGGMWFSIVCLCCHMRVELHWSCFQFMIRLCVQGVQLVLILCEKCKCVFLTDYELCIVI